MDRSRRMLKLHTLLGWLVVLPVLAACSSPASVSTLSPGARRTLTEAMGGEENAGLSVDTLREAARLAPGDAAAQERYGLAAEQARLYPEALAALDRAVAIGGPDTRRLVEKGRVALKVGDVPAAALAYRRTLELDHDNIDALSGLGVADDLQHRHTDAQARYQDALRLAPGDWGVRSNLAISYLMSGHPADAVQALAAAASDPAAPRRARHNLAMALVAAGDRTGAIAVLQKDVPAAEAAALVDEFVAFSKWLQSPDAGGTAPGLLGNP